MNIFYIKFNYVRGSEFSHCFETHTWTWMVGRWIREQLCSIPESHSRARRICPGLLLVLALTEHYTQRITVTFLGLGSCSRGSTPLTCYLPIIISGHSYLKFNFLSKLTFWALYDPSLAKDSYNWIAAVMFCMPKFPNSKASAIFSIAFKFPMSDALAKSL